MLEIIYEIFCGISIKEALKMSKIVYLFTNCGPKYSAYKTILKRQQTRNMELRSPGLSNWNTIIL